MENKRQKESGGVKWGVEDGPDYLVVLCGEPAGTDSAKLIVVLF